MRLALFSRTRGIAAVLFLAATAAGFSADRQFKTSPTLAIEAQTLVKLLEEAHYNRDAVHASDYVEVVPDYMSQIDGQRLFFLGTDRALFEKRYASSLYWNVRALGNIDPAYEIFSVYEQRVNDRVNWIFQQLDKDIDLNDHATYLVDRSKAPWPADAAAADELWKERLKFEILAELLNKKTPAEAKKTVHKRYERMLKNVGELEGGDLAEIYLSSIAQLYDPHSTYWSADTYEDFGIQMKLQLVGIGALLGVEEDNCVVKEIIPGGPADLGKQLKPNDKIISVAQNGGEPVEVIGMKLRKIVDMIRGAKGSRVDLLVQPGAATDPSARKEIKIVRDVVKLNSARAHAAVFQVPGKDGKTIPLGVITLPSFYGPAETDEPEAEKSSASKDVAQLIGQLKKAGVEGLVLDLRRNGGGFLTEAIAVTGLFVPHGPVVQVKNQVGEIQVDEDESNTTAYDGPLAVLTDRFSASASEIVTGALQNYGRAIVVGDSSTHGKGSVQTVLEMRNLVPRLARSPDKTGATKITVQKYYLPNGSSTQLKGVIPDIVLPSVEDFLPIGEKDLPHALAWDEIPSSLFDGKPLDAKILTPLREASQQRQNSLEEFAYLRRYVDWFKMRQEQKRISLNLDTRQAQKKSDDDFQKQMKAERDKLAKNDFPFKEYRLGPPPPPKIKAPKKADDETVADGDLDAADDDDDNESYGKADIPLRESLRVLEDALALSPNRQLWVDDHAPLTAQTSTKS
ncbi:carboxy terminal-processing peptidase [Horticoccus luteus]|uniref:Carboxy terminal-processing peptidase n=1 Tax=Horticoccus luteus TaxID=2862869 RepID=A0A8F9TYG5_9BACT|nr:carboxy terminal-processing peptidase [Horticoccus luteus]QYM80307.1 carboxy terminal-processing peptidase [Horticoccus luteus]